MVLQVSTVFNLLLRDYQVGIIDTLVDRGDIDAARLELLVARRLRLLHERVVTDFELFNGRL